MNTTAAWFILLMIGTWAVTHFFWLKQGGKLYLSGDLLGSRMLLYLSGLQSSGIAALCVNGMFDSVRNWPAVFLKWLYHFEFMWAVFVNSSCPTVLPTPAWNIILFHFSHSGSVCHGISWFLFACPQSLMKLSHFNMLVYHLYVIFCKVSESWGFLGGINMLFIIEL